MNEAGFDQEEKERLVAGALAMFRHLAAIAAAIDPAEEAGVHRPTMMPS
jgi:hypothetical protein